jgi:hypothetical protein
VPVTSTGFKKHFLCDPKIPKRLSEKRGRVAIDFVQFLFESYTQYGITCKSERTFAISGLEIRLKEALQCGGSYGIIDRSISWIDASD